MKAKHSRENTSSHELGLSRLKMALTEGLKAQESENQEIR